MMASEFPETIETRVPVEETQHLIASDKVEGTPVYNQVGERIGHVKNLMLKEKRTVEYVVMSFGGFLGLGERYHPIPWNALRYDGERGGYVVDVDKEKLSEAPSHGHEDALLLDPAYAAALNSYYAGAWSPFGMSPPVL